MIPRFACAAVLVGCSTQGGPPPVQTGPVQCAEPHAAVAPPVAAQPVLPVPAPTQPSAAAAAAKDNGLDDFAALTFGCPKAALNAAAREAAKVRSEGTYQFTHFDLVSDTHQGVYEIHFASNYPEEPVLRYCVAIYCQNGWDPKTTEPSVTLMTESGPAKKAAVQGAACGGKHTHAAARRHE
jgi:hypothetical protein